LRHTIPIVAVFLAACAPSPQAIGTAVAQTEAAAATATPGRCDAADVDRVSAEWEEILLAWDAAVDLASATARIALSAPVASLQGLEAKARAIVVPPCLQQAKSNLQRGMESTIALFLNFMQANESRYDLSIASPRATLRPLPAHGRP